MWLPPFVRAQACAHLVNEALREFGRLDVLVLNAGNPTSDGLMLVATAQAQALSVCREEFLHSHI